MNQLSVRDSDLEGLKIIERERLEDARGFLSRLFCAETLVKAGWSKPITQINHTVTKKTGTVRGMHFQRPPHAEMKLVSCIHGEVFDVAVDLRTGSKTFLRWHAERLTADNGHALLIPEGFAHGFQALTDDVELLYFHTAAYTAAAEGGLRATDPLIAITWPLEIAEQSSRDTQHPLLDWEFAGIAI